MPLSPSFESDVLQYVADLPYDAYGVELTAISLLGESAEGVVNITIQGTLVEHAQRHYVEIGLGTTAVTITSRYILYPEVYASYVLFITKPLKEQDARLDALRVDPGVLVPAFDEFTTYYDVWVPYGEEEVRYYLEFSEGRVEIDSAPVLNGTWQPVQYPTAEGNSSVSTIVMYQDEASERRRLTQAAAACTYSIQVIKGVYNAPAEPPASPLFLEDSDDSVGGIQSNSEESGNDVFSASAGAGMISIILGLIVGVAVLAVLVRRKRQRKEKAKHEAQDSKGAINMLSNYFSTSDSISTQGRHTSSSLDEMLAADTNAETEVFNPLAFPSPQNRFESFSHGNEVRDKFKQNLDFLDEFGSKVSSDKNWKKKSSILDANEFAARKAKVMEGTGMFSDLVSEFNPMMSGSFDGLEMTPVTEDYEDPSSNKNKRASMEDLSQFLSRQIMSDGLEEDGIEASFNPMLEGNSDRVSSGVGLLGEELATATFANPLLGGIMGQGSTEVVTQNPLSMLSQNEEAMLDFNTMTPQELVTEVIQNVEVDLSKLISTMERVPAFHQKMMNEKVAEAQDQVMLMMDASENRDVGSGEMMRLCETASQIFALLGEAQQMADHWETLQEANQAAIDRSAEVGKEDTAAHLLDQLKDIKGKLRHVVSVEKKDRRGSIADGISDELRNKLLARRIGNQWRGGRKSSAFPRKTSIHQIATLAQEKLKGLTKTVDKDQLAKSRQRFAQKQASMRLKNKREEESAQSSSQFASMLDPSMVGAAMGGMGAAVGGMFSALNPFASKSETKTPDAIRKNSYFASIRKPSATEIGANERTSSLDNGRGARSGSSGMGMPSRVTRASRAGSGPGPPLANIVEEE